MSMEQERGIENSIIECTGVCKSFETPEGEHQVIKDFNLQAKEAWTVRKDNHDKFDCRL